jgi:20S proteasome alpha/beta subunit
MTLIVGVKCSNGVVMGADGAATLGAFGQRTARQSTKKLEIIGEVVVGVSGPVGLHQRFADEVRQLWEGRAFVATGAGRALTGAAAMVKITEALRRHIAPEFQAAAAAAPVVGHAVCQTSALSQTMLALPIGNSAHLFQFDQQGAPEEASEHLPFVAIGSGQALADPFLAFIRRVLWKDGTPNLNEGIFATLWTLHHAIKTNPGGISDPMQIAILDRNGAAWHSRFLGEAEQEEHYRSIGDLEDYLGKYFTDPPAEALPAEPKPGA